MRALHGCDNTVCVRVSQRGETGLLHVVGGSQRREMFTNRLSALCRGVLHRPPTIMERARARA